MWTGCRANGKNAHLIKRTVCVSMKNVFKVGDCQEYRRVIEPGDIASFQGKVVHSVCATFALARDIEWTSRLFILQMCESDEEGIGTMLTINHKGPAFVGEELAIFARVQQLTDNELICSYEVFVEDRLIATGLTGQKILTREKIGRLFPPIK